jgi:hypothetical protein
MRHLINKVTESITDDWFKTGAFKCAKDSTAREKFEIATKPGTLQTLEGPVNYEAGYYIITGPKGEQYPMSPDTFRKLKKDNGDGTATPVAIPKIAKIADHSGIVNTSWGEPLHYAPGEDIIVRHGPNDYGVVKKDIFAQTYKRL